MAIVDANRSRALEAQAIYKAGRGNQLASQFSLGSSTANALFTVANMARNSAISKVNNERLETERAFIISGMRRQKGEQERVDRLKLASESSVSRVANIAKGVGTSDALYAKISQAEYQVDLSVIAAENKIRQTDYNFRNRIYDNKLNAKSQKIAGLQTISSQTLSMASKVPSAFDTSYMETVGSLLNTKEAKGLVMEDITKA